MLLKSASVMPALRVTGSGAASQLLISLVATKETRQYRPPIGVGVGNIANTGPVLVVTAVAGQLILPEMLSLPLLGCLLIPVLLVTFGCSCGCQHWLVVSSCVSD
jgi:hypothetical protein